MAKYKRCKTQYAGVRYREHSTRKTDNGNPDKYYFIRYRIHGKPKEEALGWASQGWNAKKASLELAKLQIANRTGEGAQSLAERRKIEQEKREAKLAEEERQSLASLTFDEVFTKRYYPTAKGNKTWRTYEREEQLYRLWIKSVIGEMKFAEILPGHAEEVKTKMREAEKAPRSINYALDVIRQVFNYARINGIYDGTHPITKGTRIPKAAVNNNRIRFLTKAEADLVINSLSEVSKMVCEQALISLHCGLRASEIFSLTWGDINLDAKEPYLNVMNSKKNGQRTVPITKAVQELFTGKAKGEISELIYPARDGEKAEAVSDTFDRVIKKLGLNKGVEDRRQKVVFHTMRHTYGSWMVQNGVPLYTVMKLMGHSIIETTQRYAHLCNTNFQEAVKAFENSIVLGGTSKDGDQTQQ